MRPYLRIEKPVKNLENMRDIPEGKFMICVRKKYTILPSLATLKFQILQNEIMGKNSAEYLLTKSLNKKGRDHFNS
jgi:hypothetical protein